MARADRERVAAQADRERVAAQADRERAAMARASRERERAIPAVRRGGSYLMMASMR